jgi:hypothetical protein
MLPPPVIAHIEMRIRRQAATILVRRDEVERRIEFLQH